MRLREWCVCGGGGGGEVDRTILPVMCTYLYVSLSFSPFSHCLVKVQYMDPVHLTCSHLKYAKGRLTLSIYLFVCLTPSLPLPPSLSRSLALSRILPVIHTYICFFLPFPALFLSFSPLSCLGYGPNTLDLQPLEECKR